MVSPICAVQNSEGKYQCLPAASEGYRIFQDVSKWFSGFGMFGIQNSPTTE
jgi:hypothetical protein